MGFLVYFAIASVTWLLHRATFNFDPFQYVPAQSSVGRYLYAQHFLFLRFFKIPFALIWIGLTFAIFLNARVAKIRKDWILTATLLLGSLAISALLSYQSYRVGYWILERQWIASIAFSTLAVSLFMWNFEKLLSTKYVQIWRLLAFVLICANSLYWGYYRISEMRTWMTATLSPEAAAFSEQSTAQDIKANWGEFARANCAKGRTVWPAFRELYGYK